MCQRCDKQVSSQGILESDLLYLPYTFKKWKCIVPGCRGGSKVKDYDMGTVFFDPSKRRTDKKGNNVRGGWWDMSVHYYMCSRHWKQRERIEQMMEHRMGPEYFLTKIVEFKTKQKQAHTWHN